MKKIDCSVLIIAQNAEKTIRRTLETLTSFDDVIVVDGGSEDSTEEIVCSFPNARFISNPWPGFIEQRNFSIEQSQKDWCFMIDADEALTPELRDEIAKIVNSPIDSTLPIYRIMRTEYFLGEEVKGKFGGASWQLRLFQTKRIRYTGGNHHEHLVDGVHENDCPELIGTISEKLRVLHDPTYGLEDWVKKSPRFVILRAEEKYSQNPNRKVGGIHIFFTFIFTFFKTYLKTRADGKVGLIIAFKTSINRTLAKLLLYERSHIGFSTRDLNKMNKYKYLG